MLDGGSSSPPTRSDRGGHGHRGLWTAARLLPRHRPARLPREAPPTPLPIPLSLQQRRNLELIVGRGLRLCDFWYGLEPKLRAALFGRVFLVRFIAWFSAFLVRFSLLYLCFRLLFANRVNLEDNVLASCPV